VVILYLVAMISSLIHPGEAWSTAGSVLWLNLLTITAFMSFITIPIAVGFAMLRYRLYDIDVLINRAPVYGSLTLVLAVLEMRWAYLCGMLGGDSKGGHMQRAGLADRLWLSLNR
jgi:hypothetical protein